MTILSTDIKLMASERLTDNDDGGGQMSAVEIQDGVVNNLFPDISRLDRTYGRVALRKLYVAVRTANQDIYYGSHAIITDAPDDPNVSVLMFSTGSYTDERKDAQGRVESYVIQGVATRYVVYGDQMEGQRTIRLFAKPDAPLPSIGDVYLLSEEVASVVQGEQQYIRVTEISHEVQSFIDGNVEFDKRIITMGIAEPLKRRFPGQDVPRYSDTQNIAPTLIRETNIAQDAKYYGIVPLQEPIAAGDMTLKANGIYGQLVPSATAETPVADLHAGMNRANVVASGAAYTVTGTIESGVFSFGRPVVPGTVNLGNGITDDSAGNLYQGGVLKGRVDYGSGKLSELTLAGGIAMTAQPGTGIYETAHTASTPIVLANRGYNYIKTLRPIPTPGTLFVDYMAQGNWYRMQDNGKGELADDQGGVGTIDYTTGTVIVTAGALPDVDSSILFTWATGEHYDIRTGDLELWPAIVHTVQMGNIVPNTLTVEWTANGVTKTATDDGAGWLTGDVSIGRVSYGNGRISLHPTLLPDSGSQVNITYNHGGGQMEVPEHTMSGTDAVFTLQNLPVRPGTFTAEYDQDWFFNSSGTQTDVKRAEKTTVTVTDNGDGTLSPAGSINYTTGQVVLPVSDAITIEDWTGDAYRDNAYDAQLAGAITTWYQVDDPINQILDTIPAPDPQLDLAVGTFDRIVPGSIEFEWQGKTYIDREGAIYTDWDRQTGSANAVGVIDYATGIMTLNSYTGGGSNTVTIKTLLTAKGEWYAWWTHFRTPGAPLRPMSFYIRATLLDGSVISAIPDGQGVISTPEMEGTVDYETGIVQVDFGKRLLDANLDPAVKLQPWYDPNDVDENGYIFVPNPVLPSSMKYNTVILSQLPLSADILGLDPVRLPVDGRVPIIRSGDVVVVHSTKTDTLPNPVSAGQTITLSRDQLASVVLEDSEGTKLDAALYTANRETGTVTMVSPLDLSAYTQPLIARHRVEDMALVNEAQINGQISLVGGISRAYDPADTWVSSALIFGDLGSRVHHQFSQATWTNEWKDERIGSNTTAQYNSLLYPIQVDNKNSIRERWALIFTSSTSFNIVGEVSGVIGTGNTSADCTPINPTTGEPYFIVLAAGWGSGWATNNVLRFNTDAAHAPVWVARTTISGAATKEDDSFKIQARGDAD
jgi:hypothetical protein